MRTAPDGHAAAALDHPCHQGRTRSPGWRNRRPQRLLGHGPGPTRPALPQTAAGFSLPAHRIRKVKFLRIVGNEFPGPLLDVTGARQDLSGINPEGHCQYRRPHPSSAQNNANADAEEEEGELWGTPYPPPLPSSKRTFGIPVPGVPQAGRGGASAAGRADRVRRHRAASARPESAPRSRAPRTAQHGPPSGWASGGTTGRPTGAGKDGSPAGTAGKAPDRLGNRGRNSGKGEARQKGPSPPLPGRGRNAGRGLSARQCGHSVKLICDRKSCSG